MADIPGTTVQFGTRFFLKLLAMAIANYLRHKATVDIDMPPEVETALNVLVELLPGLIEDLNVPGPQ